MPNPSLDALEDAVARRDGEAAYAAVLRILNSVNDRYGRVDVIEGFGLTQDRRLEQVATRFCAAFGQLICDTAAPVTPVIYEQLTAHHRWTELMFSVGGFGSSDYLVPRLGVPEGQGRRVPPENLGRFLLLFSAAAGMKMDLEACVSANEAAAVTAFLGYLGTRFCFTDQAHGLREHLLEWLPERLRQVKLGGIALQTMASPYMHCSYAMTPRKHEIKAAMMAQARRGCLEAGCPEFDPAAPRAPAEKPTVVVTCENFSYGHSIHRTHSRAVAALKERFRVVGVLYPQHVSPQVEACFDEVLRFRTDGWFLDSTRQIASEILAREPAMVLHLGVGMSPFVISLASLRLAPVQAASFGHTATTGSPQIDYMILPDDFVGDPACFGETLVRLPPHAMPYRPRDDVDFAAARSRGQAARGTGGPVRIAVPASAMKLGPPLFEALARAAAAAKVPVEFHVFPLGCSGLGHAELKRRMAARLPMAQVNEELPYGLYMERLAACDFFVCPFPYGNMNSIVDAALAGLPGVCLDGPEAHAHADAAYFKRLGWPAELVATSLDGYIAAIVRLASQPEWLARCRWAVRESDLDAAFFAGDEDLFAQAVQTLIGAGAVAPGKDETSKDEAPNARRRGLPNSAG